MKGTGRRGRRFSGLAVWRGATVFAAVLLALGLTRALLVFPFEPEPGMVRLGVAVGAVGVFTAGLLVLMLGDTVARRIGGAQVMAVSVAVIPIVLSGDGMAWLTALAGWGVAVCMSVWGIFLARGLLSGLGEEDCSR